MNRAIALVSIATLTACGGDDGTGPDNLDIIVSPAGGSVTALDGRVTMVFPANSVLSDTRITVTDATGFPTDDRLVAGSAFEIGPSGVSFLEPVEVTVVYDLSGIPEGALEEQLRLFRAVGGSWTLVEGSSVTPSIDRVTGEITALGTYGILQLPPEIIPPGAITIGLEGGTRMSDDGVLTFEFPLGAVTDNTVITIRPTNDHPEDSRVVSGTTYQLGPSGLSFFEPVTLSIEYDPAVLPGDAMESDLQIWMVFGETWTQVENAVVDETANTVSVEITEVGWFGILTDNPPAE